MVTSDEGQSGSSSGGGAAGEYRRVEEREGDASVVHSGETTEGLVPMREDGRDGGSQGSIANSSAGERIQSQFTNGFGDETTSSSSSYVNLSGASSHSTSPPISPQQQQNSLPSSSTPFFPPIPSLARDTRPPSLYLPPPSSPTPTTKKDDPPVWHVTRVDPPPVQQIPAVPNTPSAIYPAYADPSVARLPSEPSSAAPVPIKPDVIIDVSSSPSSNPVLSFSSSALSSAPRRATDYAPSSSQSPSRHDMSFSSKERRSSHVPQHSIGTHSLLRSRSSLSSRLAASLDTTTSWLILYFCFNLGLTLFNKLVLQGFPFPWTLTGIQMLSGTIGTQVALSWGFFTQSQLTRREGVVMLAFSVLYTINIAVSNLSLHLVTVPFHQVVRAMTPLFTVILSISFFHRRYSRTTYLALLPVIIGVVFATYGDYYFTLWGLVLTLFGTLLAAFKTIVTNRIQVGRLKLHPLDLLIRMSPLAFAQCMFFSWYSGEMARVREYGETEMTRSKMLALTINGVIAFGLNVVSFTANKKTSPLTMTVAANIKQVLTIILAVFIFHLELNPMNLFGIALTLGGGAFYSYVTMQEKSKPMIVVDQPLIPLRNE